jgi:hypothetical protein
MGWSLPVNELLSLCVCVCVYAWWQHRCGDEGGELAKVQQQPICAFRV